MLDESAQKQLALEGEIRRLDEMLGAMRAE
jgi:hypothetical protein